MKGACDTLKLPDRQFKRPPGIVNLDVCTETYQIATRYCPKTIKEVFIEKYAPADSCTVHQGKRKYVHK
jgi:membrane carboxypeptidase/penicillin-binding protein